MVFLLDREPDLHFGSECALRSACSEWQADAARLLLDHGADANAVSGRALRWARREGATEIVALLLEYGAVDIPEPPPWRFF